MCVRNIFSALSAKADPSLKGLLDSLIASASLKLSMVLRRRSFYVYKHLNDCAEVSIEQRLTKNTMPFCDETEGPGVFQRT